MATQQDIRNALVVEKSELANEEAEFFSSHNAEVLKAFATFQKELAPIARNAENEHFHSTFANLETILKNTKEALISAGLILTQHLSFRWEQWVLITKLTHTDSGQWIQSWYPIMPASGTFQSFGAAVTYARRFCFKTLIGLPEVDDEKEGADTTSKVSGDTERNDRVGISEKQVNRLWAISKKNGWGSESDPDNWVYQYMEKHLPGVTDPINMNFVAYNRLVECIEKNPKK